MNLKEYELVEYRGNARFICILFKKKDKYCVVYGRTDSPCIDIKDKGYNIYDGFGTKVSRFTRTCIAEFSTQFLEQNKILFHLIGIENKKDYNLIYSVLESVYEGNT